MNNYRKLFFTSTVPNYDQIVKTRFPTIFFILCYRYNILIENVLHVEFWCRSDDVTYEHKKQVLQVSKNISPLDFQDLVSSINCSVWCKIQFLVHLKIEKIQLIQIIQNIKKFFSINTFTNSIADLLKNVEFLNSLRGQTILNFL